MTQSFIENINLFWEIFGWPILFLVMCWLITCWISLWVDYQRSKEG